MYPVHSEAQELPIAHIEGEPYFDRNAACQILRIIKPERVMERLSVAGVKQIKVSTKIGPRMKTFIDERNLYRLIGRSDKPQATLKKNKKS
jgi:prophage antirepressor-like protein